MELAAFLVELSIVWLDLPAYPHLWQYVRITGIFITLYLYAKIFEIPNSFWNFCRSLEITKVELDIVMINGQSNVEVKRA